MTAREKARLALAAAEGVTAPDMARAMRDAEDFGLPWEAALAMPEELARERGALALGANAGLADWAALNSRNAAVARDNAERMEAFWRGFAAFRAGSEDWEETAAEAASGLAGGLESGQAGAGAGFGENLKRSLWRGLADFNVSWASTLWAAAENAVGVDSGLARFLKRNLVDYYEHIAGPDVEAANGLSRFGYDALRLAPQMAGNIMAGIAGGAVALPFMAAQILGSSYHELRGAGVSPGLALASSGLNAAAQAPLEKLALSRALNVFRARGSGQVIRGILGAGLGEGLTEAIQKGPEYVTRLWALSQKHGATFGERADWFAAQVADANNLRQATAEAIYEGLLGGVWGLGLAGAGAGASRLTRIDGPGEAARAFEAAPWPALGDMARSAADRAALGQALRGARENLAGTGADAEARARMARASLPENLRETWLAAEDLAGLLQANAARPQEVLDALGADMAAVNAALAHGMPLRVDTARVLASPNAAIDNMLRLEPDAMSGPEAVAFDPEKIMDEAVAHVLFQEEDEDFAAGEGMAEEGLAVEREAAEAGAAAPAGESPGESSGTGPGESPGMAGGPGLAESGGGQAGGGGFYAGLTRRGLWARARDYRLAGTRIRVEANRLTREMTAAGYAPEAARTFAELLAANARMLHDVFGVDPVDGAMARYKIRRGQDSGQDTATAPVSDAVSDAVADTVSDTVAPTVAATVQDTVSDTVKAAPADTAAPAPEKASAPGQAGSREPATAPTAPKEAVTRRGQVSLTPGEIAITVFKGKNLSTIPHEAGHIFLHMLQSVAADDGSIALSRLEEDLEKAMSQLAPGQGADFSRLFEGLFQTRGQALPARLARLRAEARAMAATAREEAARLSARAREMAAGEKARAMAAGYVNEAGDRLVPPEVYNDWNHEYHDVSALARRKSGEARFLAGCSRLAARCQSHCRALEGARRDLDTLRRWAGLSESESLAAGGQGWRVLHEATAKGLERYLATGKAPSLALGGVFAKIRAWLTRVYAAAKRHFGPDLDPAVSEVFDRMLANGREIMRARGLGNLLARESEFQKRAASLFSPEEAENLARLRDEAEAAALLDLDARNLDGHGQAFAEALQAARASLSLTPFWRRVHAVEAAGGVDFAQAAHFLGEDAASRLAEARPGFLKRKGGRDLEKMLLQVDIGDQDAPWDAAGFYAQVAEALESGNGEGAVNLLDEESLARDMARRKLARSQKPESARAGQGHEALAKYLDALDRVALRLFTEKAARAGAESEARALADSGLTSRALIGLRAAEALRLMSLADMRPERFQAALDRALNRRGELLARGDAAGALEAVTAARVANEMLRKSRAILEKADATQRLAKRCLALKPGSLPTPHFEAMRKVMATWFGDLGKGMAGEPDALYAATSLAEIIRQITPEEDVDGALPVFPEWLLACASPDRRRGGGACSWKDLRPAELEAVDGLLRYLEHMGRASVAGSVAAEEKIVAGIAGQAATAMAGLESAPVYRPESIRAKVSGAWRKLAASVDILLWQCRKADGLTNLLGRGQAGVMEREIHGPILRGQERLRSRMDQLSHMLSPHVARLAATSRRLAGKYGRELHVSDALGRPVTLPAALAKAFGRDRWTPDMLISLALNCGNGSNMARLRAGYPDLEYEGLAALLGGDMAARVLGADEDAPVSFRPPDKSLGLLEIEDWRAIQGIWDALASQWADTQAAHEKMFGFKPAAVERRGFTLRDAGGRVFVFEGGYYPVKYDPRVSERVAAFTEKEDLLSRNEAMFAAPAARRGHTMQRKDRPTGLPVLLDTRVLLEHCRDVGLFIELGGIARRADRVTRDPLFREQYIRVYGREDYEAIRPNLRGLVRQEPRPRGDLLVEAANAVRKYLVPWGLAWNLKVAALQLTAVFSGMGDVGVRPILGAAASLARDPGRLRRVWEVSPYLKSRLFNVDEDLRKAMAGIRDMPRSFRFRGRELTYEDVVNAGMLPLVAVDAAATGVVWLAAYQKELARLQGRPGSHEPEADGHGRASADAPARGPEADGQERAPARGGAAFVDIENRFHAQAVAWADTVVKQANPDYEPASRSAFLRAQNAYRLFNQFSSAVSLFASRHGLMATARRKGRATGLDLARFELYDTLLPAAFMIVFLGLAQGYFRDDDDDKARARLCLRSFLDFASLRVPVFGGFVSDGIMAFSGYGEGGALSRSGLRNSLDTPLQMVQGLAGTGGRAVRGQASARDWENIAWRAFDLASFLARIPASKKIRDWQKGAAQDEAGRGTALSRLMPRPEKPKKTSPKAHISFEY